MMRVPLAVRTQGGLQPVVRPRGDRVGSRGQRTSPVDVAVPIDRFSFVDFHAKVDKPGYGPSRRQSQSPLGMSSTIRKSSKELAHPKSETTFLHQLSILGRSSDLRFHFDAVVPAILN